MFCVFQEMDYRAYSKLSWFSFLSFQYVWPLVKAGNERAVTREDCHPYPTIKQHDKYYDIVTNTTGTKHHNLQTMKYYDTVTYDAEELGASPFLVVWR